MKISNAINFLFKDSYGDWSIPKIGAGVVVTLGTIAILNPLVIVQPGKRVVVTRLGSVQSGSWGEGVNFKAPFIDKLTYFDTRIQKDLVEGSGFSKDVQEVNVNVSVNWKVTPDKVPTLFQELKTLANAKERILVPAVNEEVKAALAGYDAESTIANRPTIKATIVKGVTERLEARGLTVIPGGVNIDNFDFSDEFESSVEAKVVAAQKAAAAVNIAKGEKEAATLQADRDIERARGKAESAKLEAEALKANGGTQVLQKIALDKWDGNLPDTLIMGGADGSIPAMILNQK